MVMALIGSSKKSFSAKEVQRQIGHNRYQSIWEIKHKIPTDIGLKGCGCVLTNEVELEEYFVLNSLHYNRLQNPFKERNRK